MWKILLNKWTIFTVFWPLDVAKRNFWHSCNCWLFTQEAKACVFAYSNAINLRLCELTLRYHSKIVGRKIFCSLGLPGKGDKVSEIVWTSHITNIVRPGNPYWGETITTVDLLARMISDHTESYWNYNFLFYETTYLNEEVNRIRSSPYIRVPWFDQL
jgi:hypothetical protein